MQDITGVLADSDIQALWDAGIISSTQALASNQIQPASLDLRLGAKAYRVRASFMPGEGSVQAKLDKLKLHEIDLSQGAVLETSCVYIVELLESLDLPETISAFCNPKSSTGRLDIFTRVIFDSAKEFDKVPANYKGPLYLEISPRTFPIIVRSGSRLSQIRFRAGQSQLKLVDLEDLQHSQQLVSSPNPNISKQGLALSVDLEGDESGLVGYRGKHHTAVIDVDLVKQYQVNDFWEPIYKSNHSGLILDPGEFYILASQESVHVPPNYAAEMTPFDPLVGEFRVHYAGFFDPGFGNAAAGGKGSRAVLEVRSHEVPFILEHGQIIGRLVYEKMSKAPKVLYGCLSSSNYQAQRLKLSKHFV